MKGRELDSSQVGLGEEQIVTHSWRLNPDGSITVEASICVSMRFGGQEYSTPKYRSIKFRVYPEGDKRW